MHREHLQETHKHPSLESAGLASRLLLISLLFLGSSCFCVDSANAQCTDGQIFYCRLTDFMDGEADGYNESFDLIVATDAPGGPGCSRTSMAKLINTDTGNEVWVGPWTYTDFNTDDSLQVTIDVCADLGITDGQQIANADFTVELYDSTGTILWDTTTTVQNEPRNIECDSTVCTAYIVDSSIVNPVDSDGDGYYEQFDLVVDGDTTGCTATSMVTLYEDESWETALFVPVVFTGSGPGDTFVTTVDVRDDLGFTPGERYDVANFRVRLYNDTGASLWDTDEDVTGEAIPIEWGDCWDTGYVSDQDVSPLYDADKDGLYESFTLIIDADGTNGCYATSYAKIINTDTGNFAWVGPWTYGGELPDNDFQVVIDVCADLGFAEGQYVLDADLTLELYDSTGTILWDTKLSLSGEPMDIECDSTAGSCAGTIFETYFVNLGDADIDGYHEAFDLEIDADTAAGCTVTSMGKLHRPGFGGSITFGPWSYSGTGNSDNFLVSVCLCDFGIPWGDQLSLSDFQVTLYNETASTFWDADYDIQGEPLDVECDLGSLGYIQETYLKNPVDSDSDGYYETIDLEIDAGSPGCELTSYAYFDNTNVGKSVLVGPFSYAGTGSTDNYVVTLDFCADMNFSPGYQLSAAGFRLRLLDGLGFSQWDTDETVVGEPIDLECNACTADGYLTYVSLMAWADADSDGYYETVELIVDANVLGTCDATSVAKLTNTDTGKFAWVGPWAYYSDDGFDFFSVWVDVCSDLGFAEGERLADADFTLELYDSTGTILWDTELRPAGGPINIECDSAAACQGTIAAAYLQDPTDGDIDGYYESFDLEIDADDAGACGLTSYAKLTNNDTGNFVWVGPWSYTGTGTSDNFLVAIDVCTDLGFSTDQQVAAADFTLELYNDTGNISWDSEISLSGEPMNIECESAACVGYLGNITLPATTDVDADGFKESMRLQIDPNTSACTATSLVKINCLSTGAFLWVGPVTYTGPTAEGVFQVDIDVCSDLGLAEGEKVVSEYFSVELYDSTGTVLWDTKMDFWFEPLDLECILCNAAGYIYGSYLDNFIDADTNGFYERFDIEIDADVPGGCMATSRAKITNTDTGGFEWTPPWTYVGSLTSDNVRLTINVCSDLNFSDGQQQATADFTVELYDVPMSTLWDTDAAPGGEPIDIECLSSCTGWGLAPTIQNPIDGDADGFNESFDLDMVAYTSGGCTAVSYVKFQQVDTGKYVWLGPWTYVGNPGVPTFNTTIDVCSDFGFAAGQKRASADFRAVLYDETKRVIWDTASTMMGEPLHIECDLCVAPGFVNSATISGAQDADVDGYYEKLDLEIDADVPGGCGAYGSARLINTDTGNWCWVGPWSYADTGTGDNLLVTLDACDDMRLVPGQQVASADFTLELYDEDGAVLWDTETVLTGEPLNIECDSAAKACPGTIFESYLKNLLDKDTDGYYESFDLEIDADTTGCRTTSYAVIEHTDTGVRATVGPWSYAGGGSSDNFLVSLDLCSDLGLAQGQQVSAADFTVEIWDGTGSTLWDSDTSPQGEPFDVECEVVACQGYLNNASTTDYYDDNGDGYYDRVRFSIDADSPGCRATSKAKVTNLETGNWTLVGPWTYSDSLSTFFVTLSICDDLGFAPGQYLDTTHFAVELFNDTLTESWGYDDDLGWEGMKTACGMGDVACTGTFWETYITNPVDADIDGYYETFDLIVDADTSGCGATSLVKLTNNNTGGSTWVGPVNYAGETGMDAYLVTVDACSVGVPPLSQLATVDFTAELYDSTGTVLWDTDAAVSGEPLDLECVASPTPTPTFTRSASHTLSFTASPTCTPTLSTTITFTPTNTATATPTHSFTHSPTLTDSASITWTATASVSHTLSHTVTSTPSITWTATASASHTPTHTPTHTPSITWTATESASPTLTHTATATPTITLTGTPTHSYTITPTYTVTPTATPSGTITETFTISPTPTISPTFTPTPKYPETTDSYVYPQPAVDVLYFVYSLDEDAEIEITLYNMNSTLIGRLTHSGRASGTNRKEFDATRLGPGIYYYFIKGVTGSGKQLSLEMGKFMVVR